MGADGIHFALWDSSFPTPPSSAFSMCPVPGSGRTAGPCPLLQLGCFALRYSGHVHRRSQPQSQKVRVKRSLSQSRCLHSESSFIIPLTLDPRTTVWFTGLCDVGCDVYPLLRIPETLASVLVGPSLSASGSSFFIHLSFRS